MPLPVALAKTPPSDPVRISGFPEPAIVPTIGACFGEFLRRVVPSHTAYSIARTVCEDVVRALRSELRPDWDATSATSPAQQSDYFIVGSVGKRSAIAPITIIDLLYVLPEKLIAQKSVDALKIVWAVIKNRYAGVTITEAGVLLQRGDHWVKIIPACERGGTFRIPAEPTTQRSSGWVVINPVAEAATLRLSDSLYGGRPRLLLTALKAWRSHADVPITSYALELLAQEFYSGSPRPFDLDQALAEFWAWTRKRTPCELKPPGGQSTLRIDDKWHKKAKAAYWRAMLAGHHLKEGKVVDAALEWKQSLGPIFPVPGDSGPTAPPMFK